MTHFALACCNTALLIVSFKPPPATLNPLTLLALLGVDESSSSSSTLEGVRGSRSAVSVCEGVMTCEVWRGVSVRVGVRMCEGWWGEGVQLRLSLALSSSELEEVLDELSCVASTLHVCVCACACVCVCV